MYADVKFHVARADPPWLVSSTAIIIGSGPPQIAVVRADGVVRLQPVQLARDLGPNVEVTSGLGEHDKFVLVPAENLQHGARVHHVSRPA